MTKIKQYLPWVVALVATFLLLLKSCEKKLAIPNNRVEIHTKTDTVYTTRIIKVPQVKKVFVKSNPKPIIQVILSKDTIRTYQNTYTDSTGVAQVIVKDSTKGTLLNQIVSIHVKERDTMIKEKTITNTITIKEKPKFTLALGMKSAVSTNSNIGAEATIKNGNGWSLDFGYNTNKQVLFGIKKDIITIYNKK